MRIKRLFSVGAVVIGLSGAIAAPASANYIFSGSGTSGNFTGQAAEPWILNNTSPFDNWGSPGVGAGVTPYLQPLSAFGMDVTFSGVGPIDAGSIAIGNASACVGGGGGGTTFCNQPFGANGFWTAFLTGPNSISFRAQNPGQILEQGELFFTNVFFVESTNPQNFAFRGEWITEFAPNPTPVPGILPLILTGLGLLQFSLSRKKRRTAIAA